MIVSSHLWYFYEIRWLHWQPTSANELTESHGICCWLVTRPVTRRCTLLSCRCCWSGCSCAREKEVDKNGGVDERGFLLPGCTSWETDGCTAHTHTIGWQSVNAHKTQTYRHRHRHRHNHNHTHTRAHTTHNTQPPPHRSCPHQSCPCNTPRRHAWQSNDVTCCTAHRNSNSKHTPLPRDALELANNVVSTRRISWPRRRMRMVSCTS